MHLQVAAIWKLSFALSFLYINSFCLLSYNQKAVTLLYFNLVFHPLQCFDCGQNRNQYIMADNLPPKKLFVTQGLFVTRGIHLSDSETANYSN